jgi:hypothetical protein
LGEQFLDAGRLSAQSHPIHWRCDLCPRDEFRWIPCCRPSAHDCSSSADTGCRQSRKQHASWREVSAAQHAGSRRGIRMSAFPCLLKLATPDTVHINERWNISGPERCLRVRHRVPQGASVSFIKCAHVSQLLAAPSATAVRPQATSVARGQPEASSRCGTVQTSI